MPKQTGVAWGPSSLAERARGPLPLTLPGRYFPLAKQQFPSPPWFVRIGDRHGLPTQGRTHGSGTGQVAGDGPHGEVHPPEAGCDGIQVADTAGDQEVLELGRDSFARYREQARLLANHLNPADRRIQAFLDRQLRPLKLAEPVNLATSTFILDRYGLARELSFPVGEHEFHSAILSSYRLAKGVLHNPASDCRTTQGVFHIAEGGLPIPGVAMDAGAGERAGVGVVGEDFFGAHGVPSVDDASKPTEI